MHLIIGLGNPGLTYKKTRHNAGCLIIEQLLKTSNLRLKTSKQSNIKSARTRIEGKDVILATPTTFMNNSGQAVQTLASYFKVNPQNIIIIHDDIDLPLGKIRIRDKGSAGGHNGIKSIIQHLGTQNFTRLKIGIGPQPDNVPSEKYVLQKLSKDQQKTFQNEIIPHALNGIKEILKNGVESAMNKYN